MSGKSKKYTFPCPNNDGVVCWYKERPCATCGWNPEVTKARLDKILRPRAKSKTNRK